MVAVVRNAILSLALAAFGAAASAAYAQDSMSKAKPGDAMKSDSMSKGGDAMKKDAMVIQVTERRNLKRAGRVRRVCHSRRADDCIRAGWNKSESSPSATSRTSPAG